MFSLANNCKMGTEVSQNVQRVYIIPYRMNHNRGNPSSDHGQVTGQFQGSEWQLPTTWLSS